MSLSVRLLARLLGLGRAYEHRRPNQTIQKPLFSNGRSRLNLPPELLSFLKDSLQNAQKDDKINLFRLLRVNCVISFHFDGFWDGFCRAFFRRVLLHKR